MGIAVTEDELIEVYEQLDGIVGWLALYGYLRGVNGLNHSEALSRVFNDRARLVPNELEALIKPSRARYLAILSSVVHGLNTWSEIKRYVEVRTGAIADAVFNRLLMNLVRYGYLSKVGYMYVISDPMVAKAIANVRTS